MRACPPVLQRSMETASHLTSHAPLVNSMKAGSPVAVLIASFVFGLRSPTLKLVSIICSISIGVAIASYGEADFNLIVSMVLLGLFHLWAVAD